MGAQTPSRASTTTWCHAVAEIDDEDFPEHGVRHDDQTEREGWSVRPSNSAWIRTSAPSVSLQTEARCGSSSYAASSTETAGTDSKAAW